MNKQVKATAEDMKVHDSYKIKIACEPKKLAKMEKGLAKIKGVKVLKIEDFKKKGELLCKMIHTETPGDKVEEVNNLCYEVRPYTKPLGK